MIKLKTLLSVPILLIVGALLALSIAINTLPGIEISSYRVIFNTLTGLGAPNLEGTHPDQRLTVAKGYHLSVFSEQVPNPRMMVFTPNGSLLVSSPRKDTIYKLVDTNSDGIAEAPTKLVTKLRNPHGLEYYKGWLYIAETAQVSRVQLDLKTDQPTGTREIIITGLPNDGGHSTRTVRVGPDEKLYLAIGSKCNACEENDPRRATLMQFNLDGTQGKIFASGLRNSVDFDWSPSNNTLFATDNGRDLLGDNYPVCELNQIQEGGFYGWPYVNDFGDTDPDFSELEFAEKNNAKRLVQNAIDPVFGFAAHNAPLGIRFLRHQPKKTETALVALHGSWNRSKPDGYKVVALNWQADGQISQQDFLTGFLQPDDTIIGRPAGVLESNNGTIYVSDDYSNIIYQITAN